MSEFSGAFVPATVPVYEQNNSLVYSNKRREANGSEWGVSF